MESGRKRKTEKDKLPLMVCLDILPKRHLQAWLPRKLQHIEMYLLQTIERGSVQIQLRGGETGHQSMIFRQSLNKTVSV